MAAFVTGLELKGLVLPKPYMGAHMLPPGRVWSSYVDSPPQHQQRLAHMPPAAGVWTASCSISSYPTMNLLCSVKQPHGGRQRLQNTNQFHT